MLEMLSLPFMQRAFVAGIVVSVLLGWIGVFVTSRRMSFIGDGIAHASLAAVAFAILIGAAPLPIALIFGVCTAIALFILEKKTNISSDTAIGILFAGGIALGVLLLQFHEGYVPELISFLFGNILAVQNMDLAIVVGMGMVIFSALFAFRQQLTFVTIDPQGAQIAGIKSHRFELALYVLTAVSVILSIKLVGIVLVSALLVLPSAITKGFSKSFTQ